MLPPRRLILRAGLLRALALLTIRPDDARAKRGKARLTRACLHA